jgi:hypothetical protein
LCGWALGTGCCYSCLSLVNLPLSEICLPARSLAGVRRPVVNMGHGSYSGKAISWPGCMRPGTSLAWWGRRCANQPTLVEWMGVYAFRESTGKQLPGCTRERGGNKAENDMWFGSCGVPPTVSPNTPVNICPTSVGKWHNHLIQSQCTYPAV